MNIRKLPKYIFDKHYRFRANALRGMYDDMPDEEYIKRMYESRTGKKLDLDNPIEFNQKLQWMKLNYKNPLLPKLVDKCEAKKYVAARIGEEYIIPTLGVWSSFEDIDFKALPESFVLKGTHDCKSVVVCKDKKNFDMEVARKKITMSLRRNYYKKYREWAYKEIPPRVIAEQYMEDASGIELMDYKVMCFAGEPKLIQIHHGRFGMHTQDFYDLEWNKLPITQGIVPSPEVMEKPQFLEEMLALSRILSAGFPEVRVDWYYADNHLYFGELTFYDAAGLDEFEPEEWNKILGDLIELPDKKG